jgi:hypothetical protein
MAMIILGSSISIGTVVRIAYPQRISPYAAGSTVTVQPGVTFVLPGGYSNVTFASNLVANVSIQLPGYGKAIIVDGVNVSLVKLPANYPTAAVQFTTWNPTQKKIGSPIFIMSVTAPGLTSFYVNITGITSNMFVLSLFDTIQGGGFVTDSFGTVAFVYQTWSGSTHTIELDAGAIQSSPGAGGAGIIPNFVYGPHLGILDAFSDNVMYFTDSSFVPVGLSPTISTWKFGDGGVAQGAQVRHVYNFTGAASFNVTLIVCANGPSGLGTGGCNAITRSILMVQWHLIAVALFIAGTGIGSLGILFYYAKHGKLPTKKITTRELVRWFKR